MHYSKSRLNLIHFIGIGGSGMCGIAEVLFNLGYKITGSDETESEATKRLKSLGIDVFIGHSSKNIVNVDLVVISTAISSENIELKESLRRNIPIMKRAEMLAGLMNLKYGIAVAGTHGKTTSTSILSAIFTEADLDPTFIIGGKLNIYDINAKLGQGKYLIVEADESDQSFLELQPSSIILTNIDGDHLINYAGDIKNLEQAFIKFIKKLPFDGLVVACGDDPSVKRLKKDFGRPTVTYGFNEENDYVIEEVDDSIHPSYFSLFRDGKIIFSSGLNIIGRHNILNAVASAVISFEEGIDNKIIKNALENFQGVARRMELKGELKIKKYSLDLIDDYGHHPTEINEILKTVKSKWPSKKVVMIFQPHRYTRTKDMMDEFIDVLSKVDHLILMDIYSAGESEVKGINSMVMAKRLNKLNLNKTNFVSDGFGAMDFLLNINLEDSVLITQGAGDIGLLSENLSKTYG